ncbi:hypothetical protein BT96DRAFT_1006531 [Gymnopus androsaceus JB14]|uniref:Uncharacterized protein n=1 Tax=Gymnopus androsaceus JB14 TaxID=1447944 RepID=A0A6A4GKC5_9AGAR|nr:hypothetical protein BT96DRAFT_1006531 [Gymnopus androsaceus JB14]
MPRTRQAIPNASITFGINGFRICTMNGLRTISIPTTSSRPSCSQDGNRLPMIEHGFEGWAHSPTLYP